MKISLSFTTLFALLLLSSGAIGQSPQTFNSGSGNYTVPAGIYEIVVEVWGAGGGGGGSNSNKNGGSGGGGGYAVQVFSVNPGQSIPYIVGTGGTAGPANNSTGGTGGQSTFYLTLIANGGTGGGGNRGAIGQGGSASGGTTNLTGEKGVQGENSGGAGGAGANGGAGGAGNTNGAGGNGTAPGGGGGGGESSRPWFFGSDYPGGAGANGRIIITEVTTYYSRATNLDPNLPSSWQTGRTGGTRPTNIGRDYQKFIVQDGHTMRTNNTWALGEYSSIQIESGGTLVERNNITIHSTGKIQVDNGGRLNHNVASETIFGGTEVFGESSIVQYGANGAQTIIAASYGRLVINGNNTKTLAGYVTVNDNLVVNNGTIFALSNNSATVLGSVTGTGAITFGSGTLSIAGDFTNSGAFARGAGTVNYNGDAQNIRQIEYHNLTISNGNTKTLTGDTRINGELNLGGVLALGGNNLTLSSGATTAAGTFSSSSMIDLGTAGDVVKEGEHITDFKLTFPIGRSDAYFPFSLEILNATITSSPAATVSVQSIAEAADGAPGDYPLKRHWVTSTTGISGSVLADVSFGYNPGDIPTEGDASEYEIVYKPNGNWAIPGGATAMGSNPLRATAATTLNATWTGTIAQKRKFYSLVSGSWDDPTTWTLDPSGTQPLNPNGVTPSTSNTAPFDEVVILSGRTVTVPTGSNLKANNKLTVIGTLDFGTTTGHVFASINGTGRIRLAADNFPAGDATNFTTAGQGEGTVEYYGTTRDLNIKREFFNVDVNMTAGNTLTLLKDYEINGNLTITSGTLGINNNSATTPINIDVNGNMLIASAGKIITGTANARHQLNLYGNFTNNGTVSFTNRTEPIYAAEATNGIVDANFLNASKNQSVLCRGITNFYRIKIDKGTDFTYTLNIDATSTDNFKLFGYANENHTADVSQLTDNRNALGLVRGSVKIGNSVVIPTLSTAGVYSISTGAQLWVDRGTVQKNSGSNIAIYGKLKITNGLVEAKTASGITFRNTGILSVEGGIVNVNQIRTSDVGTNNYGGYVQTDGTVNVLGGTTNTDYYVFSLPYGNSVFNMSGGTLNVNTSASNGGILINSDPDNVRVTGGTVIAETKASQDFVITSKAAFWNFSLKNANVIAREFTLGAASNIGPDNVNVAAQPLKVLNDFRIWGTETGGASYAPITFTTGTSDVYIGGSFYVENGAKYVPISGGTPPYDAGQPTSRNTTYFNQTAGTNAVEVLYQGDPDNPLEFGNVVVDRSSGNEVKITSSALPQSVVLDINGTTSVLSGSLNQNLHTIRTWGNIINNDRMGTYTSSTPSAAQIRFVGNPSITTTANAIFGNVQINVTPPSKIELTSDVYIERMEYVKGLIYLKNHNLKVDNLWNLEKDIFENSATNSYLKVGNSGYSGNSMIYTDGKASDGGLSIKIKANSLEDNNENNILNNFGPVTFPIGFTPDGGATLYFRPAQMVVKNFADDGYVTIRTAMGPLLTLNAAGGEVLQQFWRVSSDNFETAPTVAFRFYYRNRTGGGLMDLITENSANEVNYVPGKVQDVTPYTRLYEPLTDNDIIKNIGATNTRVITFNGTSTSGSFSPTSNGFTLENSNFTAGAAACFAGSPTHYYSNASYGEWNVAATWDVGFIGSGVHAVPTTGSIVHIYSDISTPANLGQVGRISIENSGIPNPPAEIIFEMPNLPLELSTPENVPRLQFWRNGTYNLGFVRGTGMISYGNTAVITNGDFGDFGTNPYSYYLFFSGSNQLTTIPTPIPNMMIEYSTNINQNITVNYDLIVQGNAVVHPLQNVNIKRDLLLGFWRGATFRFPATGSAVKVTVGRDIDFTRIPIPGEIGNRLLNVSTSGGSLEHTLIVKRSIIQGSNNNFGINLYGSAARSKAILEFQGTDNGTYTRTSTSVPVFYRMVMNKGTSQAPSFSFDDSFTLDGSTNTATKAITMTNGTLILNDAAINVNLTTGNDNFDIPSTAGLDIRQGTARANGTSGINLDGKLTIGGGTLDMSGGDNPIEYSASGKAAISVTSGTLTVGGQIRRSPTSDVGILSYNQTGGAVVVGNDAATYGNRGVFEILNAGSSFTMTGGDLYIARAQTSPTISAFYFDPAAYNVGLAANINIGHSSTPASQTIGIFAGKPLPRLRVNNSSTSSPKVTAKLEVVPATITSLLQIDVGTTLNANGINLTLKGDMDAKGTFVPNGNTTYLSGNSDQTIKGNGTTELEFFNLDKTSSNKVILEAPNTNLLVSNELYLRGGIFTDNGNTITVKGDVLNDATHETSIATSQGIVLNGNVSQELTGNGTFGTLSINNLSGVNIPVGNQLLISRSLRMESGVLYIDNNLLDIGVDAVIEQVSLFSSINMIETNISFTDDGLRKTFPAGPSSQFIFPVGSNDKYTPVTVTPTENGSVGSITVKPANEIHPSITENTDKNNVLQYYWTLTASGLTGFSSEVTMRYIDTDVKFTAPNTIDHYITAHILGDGSDNWLKYGTETFDEVNKNLIYEFEFKSDTEISGDFTAGVGDAIPQNVAKYETVNNGNWTTETIWSPTVANGPSGGIAKINAEHTVDVTTNNLASYITEVYGTLNLNSTFGHRLGILNGTGTLYLQRGDMPAAVYDDFFSSTGGTIEFGGSSNYELLGNITQVNNLKLSGTGVRKMPNNNILLNGDFIISGGEVLNYYNRKMSVKGNITRSGGSFYAGSGANATIALVGTGAPQTITGSFSGNNALNNLVINNTNGVSISNDVEINGELKLTNGLLTITNPLESLKLNYGATVSPAAGTQQSFVNGALTKEMMNGNSFTFPIGNFHDTKAHGPIALQTVTGPPGINNWKASYFYATAPHNTTVFAEPIQTVSQTEYWNIVAPTNGASKINITLDGSSDVANSIANPSDLRVAGWNTTTSRWEIVGEGATVVGTKVGAEFHGSITTTGYVNHNNYTNFTLATIVPVAASTATITNPADGKVNLCKGSSTNIEVTFTGEMPYTFTYFDGTTSKTVSSIMESTYLINVNPSVTTTYTLTSVTSNGVPGTITGITSAIVTIIQLPTVILHNSPASPICEGTEITFTATSGLTNYQFRLNGAVVHSSETNTFTSTSLAIGTQSVDVIGTNTGGCSATSGALAITVKPKPAAAGTISGPVSVCKDAQETYTVPAIPNATTGYVWSASNGATGSSTSNSINLTFPNSGASEITVYGTNACGNGASSSLTVTVSDGAAVTQKKNIDSGSTSVCQGSESNVYTVPPIANATSYMWFYSGSGVSEHFSQTAFSSEGFVTLATTITLDFSLISTGGNLTVKGISGCSDEHAPLSDPYPITVNEAPTASIAQDLTACSGTDLVITATPSGGDGDYSHAWTGTGAGSLNNSNIAAPTFNSATSDNYNLIYTVTDGKGCKGTASTMVSVAQAPVANAGSDLDLCLTTSAIQMTGSSASGSFSGSPTWSGGGTLGSWTQDNVAANAQFFTSSVSGTFTATLTLTGSNGCADVTDTRLIKWSTKPEQPGAFTESSTSVCQGETGVTYTIPDDPFVTTYNWTYTVGTGATITASRNSITIDFSSLATSGKLNVTATNACGTSIARTLDITVNTSPAATITPGSNTTTCAGATDGFSVTSNEGWNYEWSVEDGVGTVIETATPSVVDVNWNTNDDITWPVDTPTNIIKKVQVTITAGSGECPQILEWDVTIYRVPETGPQYHIPNAFGE